MKKRNTALITLLCCLVIIIAIISMYLYKSFTNNKLDNYIINNNTNNNFENSAQNYNNTIIYHDSINTAINSNGNNNYNNNSQDSTNSTNNIQENNKNSYFNTITMDNANSSNLYKATNEFITNLDDCIEKSDITAMNIIVNTNISDNFNDKEKNIIENFAYRLYKNKNNLKNISFDGVSRKFVELVSIENIDANYQYCTYEATIKYIFTQEPLAVGDITHSYEKTVTEYIKLNSDGKISSIIDKQ